jgi:hypothetical protein
MVVVLVQFQVVPLKGDCYGNYYLYINYMFFIGDVTTYSGVVYIKTLPLRDSRKKRKNKKNLLFNLKEKE